MGRPQEHMGVKQEPFSKSQPPLSSMKSSSNQLQQLWKEKAFAEDDEGKWPPRSYSCSFCKREFRSAQALGGHMNIHRRERAKLKYSHASETDSLFGHSRTKSSPARFLSSSPSESFGFRNDIFASPYTSLAHQEPHRALPRLRLASGSLALGRDNSRRKISLTAFVKPPLSSKGGSLQEEEINGLKHSSAEGLDLELRLGRPPKLN